MLPTPDLQWESEATNPLRRIFFYFALALIFIRFSVIHEALAVALNLNLYLLYFVLPPTILGIVITGGIGRALRARSTKYWLAFLVWLCLATAFSIWRGGSAAEVFAYAKSELIMLFAIAGLVMTWKEYKVVMFTLGLAAFTDLAIGRLFVHLDTYRVDLAMGGSTIGNSNDFAAHLILMMAFLFYFLVAPKSPTLIRFASVPAISYCIYLIISTASRGALLALIICALFAFLTGSSRFRIVLLVSLPIAAVVIVSLLPRTTLLRLATLTSTQSTSAGDVVLIQEAEGSSQMREELFKKSIQYTLQHPLFGVGPKQFASYEGGESTAAGRRGMWHQTHNMFTQVSSECGIPALLFFLCAIGSALRLAIKTFKSAKTNPMNADIKAAAFCLMLGIIGFISAAFFLNLAYRFYEPALCGLCIALYSAAEREMAARQARAASAQPITPPWAPPQPVSRVQPATGPAAPVFFR